MPSPKRMIEFFASDEGTWAKNMLSSMVDDTKYNTDSIYSSNSDLYPDNLMPFVDRHMDYLGSHPDVIPDQYISNLRLMTRLR